MRFITMSFSSQSTLTVRFMSNARVSHELFSAKHLYMQESNLVEAIEKKIR